MSKMKIAELLRKGESVHLIGVLGAGMLPLARLLIRLGYRVSGSDLRMPERELPPKLEFWQGHAEERLLGTSLCVFSLAVPDDDAELSFAHEHGIKCISRPELLGALVSSFPISIAVAGSHGKSTVTAMLSTVLRSLSPTVLCGADIGEDGFVAGEGEILIYEACEYRDAFLSTTPTFAVLLNLELDHTDYFADISALEASFSRFAASARRIVFCADDERLSRICRGNSVSFGRCESSDYLCMPKRGGLCVLRHGLPMGCAEMSVLGDFNLINATAAVAVASELGLSFDEISDAIESFHGIPRRLERLGSLRGAPVLYDYAHHPTEIAAGISAIRAFYSGPVTIVFRPHTYTRTRSLEAGFIEALSMADRVILLDVFAAREPSIDGVSSRSLAEKIGPAARYAATQSEAADMIISEAEGAVILMGAGEIIELKEKIEKNLDK